MFETAPIQHGGMTLQERCYADVDFIATCQYPVDKPFPIHDGEIGAIVKLGRGGEIKEVVKRVCIHARDRSRS